EKFDFASYRAAYMSFLVKKVADFWLEDADSLRGRIIAVSPATNQARILTDWHAELHAAGKEPATLKNYSTTAATLLALRPARVREGGRLPLPLCVAELQRRPSGRLRAAGQDQRRVAGRDPGRGDLRPQQRPGRAVCGGAEHHHGRRQLRPGAAAVADHRRSPPLLPRPHEGAAMSVTAEHPLPSADRRSGAPAAPLPVLAVDLVTDPALAKGIAPLARGLEEAGIGALTFSDGGLHPIHVAAHLAPLTRAIGLLPRTDAIYVEPFHLATQLMSLDH